MSRAKKAAVSKEPETPLEASNLGAKDKAFLGRVMRFLVNIQTPTYAPRARREGYTPQEHKLGWSLLRMAGGEDRPFDHWLTEQSSSTVLGPALMEQLKTADSFENTWYPRVRAIIRRVVSRENRDSFEAAFFQGLEQQPPTPAVIGSVGGLISRVRSLKESNHPEASKVLEMLTERGLNEAKLKEIESLLLVIEKGIGIASSSGADPQEVATAQERQFKALEELRGWFNDWATTLRSVFNSRECVILGLSMLRRNASGEEVVEEEETDEDEEDEEDAEDIEEEKTKPKGTERTPVLKEKSR